MIRNNTNSECYNKESLDQVSTLITGEKKLQAIRESLSEIFEKSLGELFERCINSTAIEAEEYQRLTELAAKLGVSTEEVKKAETFLNEQNHCVSNLHVELRKKVRPLKSKSNRKAKKKVKRHLEILSEINLALTKIVEQCWWYLSLKQREYLEELTTSLASLAPDLHLRFMLDKRNKNGFLLPNKKVYFRFYLTTTMLINAVVNTDDSDEDFFSEDNYLAYDFLSFLDEDIEKDSSNLVPYTEEMDLTLNRVIKRDEVD